MSARRSRRRDEQQAMVSSIRSMEYIVIRVAGQVGRAKTFAEDTASALNELGKQGWRLITVDDRWAYSERPKVR